MIMAKEKKEGIRGQEELREGYISDYATGKPVKDRPEEGPRQLFEKRLVEEYGYSKGQIEIEFMIQKGTREIGPADIVVFHDARRKTFDNIKIIVETKRKERKDGIDQLRSYSISPSQEFAVWFNGKEILFLQVLKKAPWFREIPDIPKKGETLEDVGLYYKKDLKPATELKSVFEICHNYIYANEGLLKEKVFNEVLKLIFIKMADEKKADPRCEFRITDKELKELEEGKQNEFMDRILKLFNEVKTRYSDVFDDRNERINLKPLTVAFVVSQLQKYSLITTAADVKGTAFQTFVYAHQRGERGEFFTPHPIVELAVKMLDPKDNEKFIDPACGSGGFLVRGMNWVKEKFIKDNPHRKDEANEFLKEYAHAYIAGIDINPDLAKVAKMHMVLYDDGHTGIFAANSLLSFHELVNVAKNAGVSRALWPEQATFKVLMTNPPFGTKGKVTDKRILENFDLGHKWKKEKDGSWTRTNKILDGQVPDILFIERCLQLLENHGKMAIVLPNGDLNNSSLEYVREYVKQNSRILAVVSLPVGTFMSAGSNPQPSVLFLEKLSKKEAGKLNNQDYPIFMAIAEKIGYDLKTKTAPTIYKKDEKGELIRDKQGNPIVDSDIPEIIEAFNDFKRKHNLGF
jgi:type I restriction enzyme M protein